MIDWLVGCPVNKQGFIRGVGIGIVGVAVNPVLGVTDGISSAAQAVSYSVSEYRMPTVRRQPRILNSHIIGVPSVIFRDDPDSFTPRECAQQAAQAAKPPKVVTVLSALHPGLIDE